MRKPPNVPTIEVRIDGEKMWCVWLRGTLFARTDSRLHASLIVAKLTRMNG